MGFMAHLFGTLSQHPYDTMWGAFGFLGQAVFGIRFLIQWLKSEQAGHSVIPIASGTAAWSGPSSAWSMPFICRPGPWPWGSFCPCPFMPVTSG